MQIELLIPKQSGKENEKHLGFFQIKLKQKNRVA